MILTTAAVRHNLWSDATCSFISTWHRLPEPTQLAVCATCPVIEECREEGVEHYRLYPRGGGEVYGGMSPAELLAEAQRRPGPARNLRNRKY